MEKPEKILELEKFYTLTLNQDYKGNELIKFGNKNFYQLNSHGEIIGLNLRNNQISDITPLSVLTELQILKLNENLITDISPLSSLKKLKELHLNNNQIIEINILSTLVQLKKLYLNRNKIIEINSLSTLTELNSLNLSNNKIIDIRYLNNLKKTQFLDLCNNQISDITQLADLENIQFLSLGYNQIGDISPLLFLIQKGIPLRLDLMNYNNEIVVGNNPLHNPPIEIVDQGNDAVIRYWKDAKKSGVKPLNECKVILLGDGELGKTSLMKKLIGLPFSATEKTTHGINKKSWNEIRNDNYEKIKVNLWDFGGQHIQHSLHQFFLTKQVIYVLLLNPRNDTNAMYWLDQIDKLGKDSEILIVYNWKDETDRDSHNLKNFYELRKKYPSLKEPFLLSCKEGEGFEAFKSTLIKTILQHKDLKEQYPGNWFSIKNELEKVVTIGQNYILYGDYDTICNEHQYTDDDDKKNLLIQLDKIGSIVYFNKPILQNHQVMNPDWITTGAYAILTSEVLISKKGILNNADLKKIFRDPIFLYANEKIKIQYKESDFEFIIALMSLYDLCVKNPFEESEYLIPCTFEGEKPKEFDKYKVNSKHYRFQFESSFEMLIIYRFMARTISKCVSNNSYWQSGIVLKEYNREAYAMVETNQFSKQIDFWISGDNIRGFWEVLRDIMKSVIKKYSLNYQEQILYVSDEAQYGVFFAYDELINCLKNNILVIDYDRVSQLKNIDVLNILDNFEDTSKLRFGNRKYNYLNEAKTIKIFLASSNELEKERKEFILFITNQNKRLRKQGIFLEVVQWSQFKDEINLKGKQEQLNEEVKKCQIALCLFFSKAGIYTVQEFNAALEALKSNDDIKIYTYFKNADIKIGDIKRQEINSLLDFKEKLTNLGHFIFEFENIDQLHIKFIEQLQNYLE